MPIEDPNQPDLCADIFYHLSDAWKPTTLEDCAPFMAATNEEQRDAVERLSKSLLIERVPGGLTDASGKTLWQLGHKGTKVERKKYDDKKANNKP
jgi:hypothetical protein